MKIEELKQHIEAKTLNDDLLILACEEHNFVAQQYLQEIAQFKNLKLNFVEEIDSLIKNINNIFNVQSSGMLNVFLTNVFDKYDTALPSISNLIIICNKVDKSCADLYNSYIVNIPKLEQWQIRDYTYSNLATISKDKLDWLLNICKYDIFRLDNEIQKLTLFDKAQHETLFNKFITDNVFNDLSEYTVFNFSNAIIKRDKPSIIKIYNELNNIDINEMGLLTILYTNFRNIISIQMGRNVTAESLGIKQNQFNAIKWNCGKYSNAELLEIFKMLTSLDLWVKDGTLAISDLIDYMLVKIVRR